MRNLRSELYIRLPVVVVAVLLGLCYSPIYDLFGDDKEVYRYGGMLLLKGGIPYRDLFDHTPPLIFFINFAGLLLGAWGGWIINVALSLLSALVFFKVCRRYRLPFPWLLPVLFLLLVRDHLINSGMGMTREYTSFFLLLFFSVLMGGQRNKFLLLGLLTGLIFFTQQEQVLTLAPLLAYACLAKGDGPVGARIGRAALGFCLVAIPIVGFFAVHGALGAFWADSFSFSFHGDVTAGKSFWDHFRTAKHGLDWGNYEIPFMLAAASGIIALFLPGTRKGLLIAALASLVASFSAEWLGARTGKIDFLYYFVALSAPICFVLFTVMAETGDRLIPGRVGYAVYGSLLCCSLVYSSFQHGTHLERQKDTQVPSSPEMAYLQSHRPGDSQLYVMGQTGFIYAYNQLRILSPSPRIDQRFWKWYPGWDPDQALIRGIGQDLLSHHTIYVVMDTISGGWRINPANSNWWLSFMDRYYQPVPLKGTSHSLLWKIKDSLPTSQER